MPEPEYGDETRRKDGGGSFYPGPTVCYMVAAPVEQLPVPSEKSHEEQSVIWKDHIEELTGEEFVNDNGDFIDPVTGRQVLGNSSRTKDGAIVYRSCFYDEEPGRETRQMVQSDIRAMEEHEDMEDPGFTVEDFMESFQVAEDLYNKFIDEDYQSQEASEFISAESADTASGYMNCSRDYATRPVPCPIS